MGSVEGTQVVGQFMHPLIDQDTKNDDPWQRNYYQPPRLGKLVPRTYPLIDIRPSVSDVKYTPADLLKSHGFGVVKHNSALFEPPNDQGDLTEQVLTKVYYPEIQDLVKETTGAKHVFVLASIIRRGASVPEVYKMPTGVKLFAAGNSNSQTEEKEAKPGKNSQAGKPAHQAHIALAAPVRIPHLDFTPLGARQTIRSQARDIYNTAVESGVISAEDKICKNRPFLAQSKGADPIIAEQYNGNGKLGPRYAAYTVWRPLKKIGRDPLTLAPRRYSHTENGDLVYWPYENKVPGHPDLGGDFLKQYAMLGVRGESPVSNADSSSSLKWYYLPGQDRDEVLVVKLFDSASLGEDSQDASAPWHASPEIGSANGDHPRESIELRVLAFW